MMATADNGMIGAMELARRIELERQDAARMALEEAAGLLESHNTNQLYHRALKIGAELIRRMKR